MKKTYITPALMHQRIYGTFGFMENLSPVLDSNPENALDEDEILVKRNQPSAYNVWNDDWSK